MEFFADGDSIFYVRMPIIRISLFTSETLELSMNAGALSLGAGFASFVEKTGKRSDHWKERRSYLEKIEKKNKEKALDA